MIKNILSSILISLLLISCDSVESNEVETTNGEWLIPESEVYDGGPGKDGIPALLNPEKQSIANITYLDDRDLVIVFKDDQSVLVYPHKILDWHEIINDNINYKYFAITYCPLTGSAICWDRILNGTETTFGVSGLLFNSNLLPYDRLTNSYWSQMKNLSVKGNLSGSKVETYAIIETSWKTAKTIFPQAMVVTTNTGYSRNYNRYPYGNYKTSNSFFIFPVSHQDSRLPSKERVLGIKTLTSQRAYQISEFENLHYIIDRIDNEKYIVVLSSKFQIATAFKLRSNVESNIFKILAESMLPFILEDEEGIKYDLFGVSDSELRDNLEPADSFIAYWFAWAAFFPNTEIYSK